MVLLSRPRRYRSGSTPGTAFGPHLEACPLAPSMPALAAYTSMMRRRDRQGLRHQAASDPGAAAFVLASKTGIAA